MLKGILVSIIGSLLLVGSLFAADGDLLVNGSLGVGIPTPQRVMHIHSTSPDAQMTISSVSPSLSLTNDLSNPNGNSQTAGFYLATVNGHYGLQSGDAMLALIGNSRGNFYLNSNYSGSGTTHVILQPNSGNLGVGTIGPSTKMQIAADSAGYGELTQAQFSISGLSDSYKRLSFGFHTTDNVGWIQSSQYGVSTRTLALQPNGGKVSIGTTNPGTYNVYLIGSAFAQDGVWQDSDMSLKENIKAIDSPLNKILNMEGITFTWKIDGENDKGLPEGKRYGVLAQAVEGVMPEAVKENANGGKAVAYSQIIPVLIEAIKEQQKEIERLKAKVGL